MNWWTILHHDQILYQLKDQGSLHKYDPARPETEQWRKTFELQKMPINIWNFLKTASFLLPRSRDEGL